MSEAVSRLDRITVDPSICHGAPTIRGMRLRVQDVLELLASGMTYDEVLTDYDELAHHCGPERIESFQALDGVDAAIGTLAKAAEDAPAIA